MLRALKPMVSGLEIHGVGGPKMAEIAGHGLCDWVEDAAVMGVWEVLKRYGWFKERFARMLAELKEFRPDVLLLIDYPGFNLRFAEAVKRECPETRVVYFSECGIENHVCRAPVGGRTGGKVDGW